MKYKENLMERLGHTNLDALLTQEEYEEPVTLYLVSPENLVCLMAPFFLLDDGGIVI